MSPRNRTLLPIKPTFRLGAAGSVGLVVGLVAAAIYLIAIAGPPASGQAPSKTKPPAYKATERIDVEQSVDFPYDI